MTGDELIGARISNYRIKSLLGRGGMGVVYLAQDEALFRDIALKVLPPSSDSTGKESGREHRVELFLAEARNVASISHPGIVQIHHVGRHQQRYFIAMEYVRGKSIDLFLQENGPSAPDIATELLLQAANALNAAHQANVIHRDVKPGNLLIDAEYRLKLTDFGLALTKHSPAPNTQGFVGRVGTPLYMAPEIWQGSSASILSDIYSLGASYYQILTGSALFGSQDQEQLKLCHINQTPPDPRTIRADIPEDCVAVLMRCLAKQPRDRFRSTQELCWAASITLEKIIRSQRHDKGSSGGTVAARPKAGLSPSSDPIDANYRPAAEALRQLGLAYQPFGTFDPSQPLPYDGPPFAELMSLASSTLQQPGAVVFVIGPPGSGREALCLRQVSLLQKQHHLVFVDLEHRWNSSSLLRRVCIGATSTIATSSEVEMQALLRHLASAKTNEGKAPIIAIYGLNSAEMQEDLSLFVRAAATTRSFGLLLCGMPHTLESLYDPDDPLHQLIRIPPLRYESVGDYIRGWIERCAEEGSPPIIVTPDASLLIAYWSGGIPKAINTIAHNMLYIAAYSQRRLLTSWEAWIAAKHMARLEDLDQVAASYRDKPASWPYPEVSRILEECRGASPPPPPPTS